MSISGNTSNSKKSVHAMLDYIQAEVDQAESPEQIAAVLKVIKTMWAKTQPTKTVTGLSNIRAEVMMGTACNVSINVPESLISTFYDLSDKMNQLQSDDPETFTNASKALHWLANNDKCVN